MLEYHRTLGKFEIIIDINLIVISAGYELDVGIFGDRCRP